jgi:predicted metal-dependent phosphoesterase TrpH
MRRFVDLHTHSTASDGAASPRELIRLAEGKRLAAIALTDHDTTAGLSEAADEARACPLLRFVPGVEMSAKFPKGTLHILGLGIDPCAPAIQRMISHLRAARDERNPRIVAALRALGCPIDMDDVRAIASGGGELAAHTVGRVHIAEALRRKGCVKTVADAFQRLIGQGCPAFIDKEKIAPADVIRAIAESGGAAVLAHPPQLLYENLAQLERIVRSLVGEGLAGIEAYHSDHTPEQTREYMKLARRFGIGVTGGSDFHGAAKPDVKLGRPPVPLAAIEGPLRDIVLGPERGK